MDKDLIYCLHPIGFLLIPTGIIFHFIPHGKPIGDVLIEIAISCAIFKSFGTPSFNDKIVKKFKDMEKEILG